MTTHVPTWRASVNAAGTRVSGDLTLSCALNSYAQASASVYPGDTSGAATVPVSAVATLMGGAQLRALLQSEAAFTASLSVDGESLDFVGYEMQPGCQAGVGSFNPRIAAQHSTSMLSRLQMSLYSSNLNTPLDEVTSTSIPERILLIVQRLVRDWIKYGYPTLSQKDKELAMRIHEANTEPLQVLERILSTSPAFVLPELTKLLDLSPAWHHALNQWIAGSLLVGVGDFFGAFTALLEQMGLMYAPAFGKADASGRVIGLRDALAGGQERSVQDTAQLSMPPIPPASQIARVVIEKIPTQGLLRGVQVPESSQLPGQASPTSVVYPTTNRIGRSLVMNPPAFLSPVFSNMQGGSSGFALKPGTARERLEELTAKTVAMTDALRAYLLAVAKNVYAMTALQGSQAGIVMPLDLTWEVGNNYTVSGQGRWFTGLLSQVTHQISSNSSSAQTTLQFSHVQWNGFSVSALLT